MLQIDLFRVDVLFDSALPCCQCLISEIPLGMRSEPVLEPSYQTGIDIPFLAKGCYSCIYAYLG